ncbi:MAG: hypothetical protein HWD59_05390 [Coxiellaceae bacterium]|nr:MAG: hypothetical protein HWD59_05390 [Coxiellaceae bacterium]
MPKSTKHQVVEYIPTKQVELLAAELKEITGDKIRQFIVDKLGKENLRTADLRNLYVKEFINSNEQRLGITVEKSQISLDGHISLSDATLNFYEKIKINNVAWKK